MSQTIIAWGDPKAQKVWSPILSTDTIKKSYWNNRFVAKGTNSIIERKDDLESHAGDRVSFDLSVQLRGGVVRGDKRLEGTGEDLKFYTDEIIIDQCRKEVRAGSTMTQKRTSHNLRQVGRDRLSDYWSAWLDELHFIYLSGARGINEDFKEPVGFTGHAGNALRAPDADHIMFGGDATSKASIVADDKMTRLLIERASTYAHMLPSRNPDNANMLPVTVGSAEHYVVVMTPDQEHAMRTEATTNGGGWQDIQKAAAAAEGASNPLFKGSLGMINNVILHAHRSVIRFSDYGAGGDVPAARALFMGRQAGVCAYGVSNGRWTWKEDTVDHGNEAVVASGTIIGMSKTRFNGKDFSVIALDTAAAPTT